MSEQITEGLHEQAIVGRVSWLIRMRWLAVLGLSVSALVAGEGFPVTLPDFSVYALLGFAAFIGLYNLIFLLRLRQVSRFLDTNPAKVLRCMQRLTHLQIIADLVCLTIILDLAGGLINPLCLFMIFHIAIAGIILHRIQAFRVALLASCLLLVMGMTGKLIPSWRVPLGGFPLEMNPPLTENWFFISATWFAYTITFFLIAYFTTVISGQLRDARDKLEEANAILKKQDQTKSKFMRVVAHQLRSPLGAILSLIHAYSSTGAINNKDAMNDLYKRIEVRCHSLLDLVNDLLRLTQITEELDKHEEEKKIDMSEAINDVVNMYKQHAEEHGLKLLVETDNSNATIRMRERDISDILGNLVSNAIKYTNQGEIKVAGYRRGDKYTIEVSDTGIGIPEESQANLFDEFYRAPNAKKRNVHSSGLGLNIVRAIVQRLRGNISFTSAIGKGTTFTIELPLN